jgi:hypothetical protein
MQNLRAAKLIASSILAGSGAISLAVSERGGGLGFVVGGILLLAGAGLLVWQWREGGGGVVSRHEPMDSNAATADSAQSNARDTSFRAGER